MITFGVAPAFLAWMWGFRSISPYISYPDMVVKLSNLGAIAAFAFLIAGASRLARFNITINPQPSNPGRPGRKYFVGMPIPAGAGVIAAVVHFTGGDPPEWWGTSMTWLVVIVIAAYLMVSTWRFYSLKDIDFRSRQPFRLIVIFAIVVRRDLVLFAAGAVRDSAVLHVFWSVLAIAVGIPAQAESAASNLYGGFTDFMNSNIKIRRHRAAWTRHAVSTGWRLSARRSLKGKEVAEVLDQRNFPSLDVKLLDDDESLGQLEAVKDEITFIQSVRASSNSSTWISRSLPPTPIARAGTGSRC